MTRPPPKLHAELQAAIHKSAEAHHFHDRDVYRAMAHLLNSPWAPDPYERTTVRGPVLDQLTHYALLTVEHRLRYAPGSLTITQGSYNAGGVKASGRTHDGGGVVDLTPQEWQAKVHALRAVGFAAWHRPAIAGLWPEHVHAVLIGNRELSPAAQAQVRQYRMHLNGLADAGPDNSWHPDPIPVFRMPHYRMESK